MKRVKTWQFATINYENYLLVKTYRKWNCVVPGISANALAKLGKNEKVNTEKYACP